DAPPREALVDRLALAASFEQAWTSTDDRWSGFGASACMRFGALCFGARVRYLGETVVAQLTAASRHDLSALATASWSTQVGQMSIAPELGIGVGRMTTDRIDGCKVPPPCDPATDPNCKQPPAPPPCTPDLTSVAIFVGDNFRAATVTPRAEAALRV